MFSDFRQLGCIQKQSILAIKRRDSQPFKSQLPSCCFWSELKVNGQVLGIEEQCVLGRQCHDHDDLASARMHVSSRDCYGVVLSRCVEVCFRCEVCFVSVFP